MRRLNPIIALTLSFIPGLGQVYNRQYQKAILFELVLVAGFILSGITGILLHFNGLVIATLSFIAIYLLMFVDAFRNAARRQTTKSRQGKFRLAGAIIVIISVFYVFGSNDVRSEILDVGAFYYPSGASMQPTIQDGDFVILHTKAFEQRAPQKGEVVVFWHPDYSFPLTKRIIAIDGETISGSGKDVFVDGLSRDEPYAWYGQNGKMNFGPITVPAGQFFVMGDNRDDSRDSRDSSFGFLDPRMLIGKPLYVYWARKTKRVGTRLK